MKKTSLYDWHVSHGAKMVEFGGYLMPVFYEGILAEHQAVRERCGLFDISHMGEFFIEGEAAGAWVQFLTSNDVGLLGDHQAQYSLLLNERGYALDDVIVYRLTPKKYMLCVNAANIEKDLRWIQSKSIPGASLEDRSDAMGMLALQGPRSPQVLKKLGVDLEKMKRFETAECVLQDVPVLLSRTGYTGEAGCEMFVANAHLIKLWEALLKAGEGEGIMPVGLGARDTLRLEMGYVLYGHELSEEIHPLEAGLSWVIKLDQGDFVGRDALIRVKEAGVKRKVVGLVMEEPGIPRDGMPVLSQDRVIGGVLSGTQSPTLKQGIATALLDKDRIPSDGAIFIDIRGKMKKAKIRRFPLVKGET
jgi:aminomethyltransferase